MHRRHTYINNFPSSKVGKGICWKKSWCQIQWLLAVSRSRINGFSSQLELDPRLSIRLTTVNGTAGGTWSESFLRFPSVQRFHTTWSRMASAQTFGTAQDAQNPSFQTFQGCDCRPVFRNNMKQQSITWWHLIHCDTHGIYVICDQLSNQWCFPRVGIPAPPRLNASQSEQGLQWPWDEG